MGGTERQQRDFLFRGRPAAAVLALGVFAIVELIRPSERVETFLALAAAFAVTTIPGSWFAAQRWSVEQVTRVVLVVDVLMVTTFVWALDRESLLVVVYFAPIAFGALIFGPRATIVLAALSLLGALAVATLRDYDEVAVAAHLVLLVALSGVLALLSRQMQTAQRQLAVDAAAFRIAERFRESLDLDVVLGQAVRELAAETGAARARLRLAPRADGSAPLYVWERPDMPQLEVTTTPPLTLRTLASREPVIIEDAEDTDPELRGYLDEFGARSYLGYPIIWQDEPIAALGLFDDRPRRWKRPLALLERVVPQLAVALLQADLYRREQDTAELREQLVANVSHELRTPLTATIGFLKTLEREDVELPPQQRQEFLAVARREAERLARLVDDLLNLARLERGQISLVREPTGLRPLLEQAVAGVPAGDDRSVRVAAPDELVASLDADRMLQVFSNLISNAVRHGAGEVTVEARGEGPLVRVTVSDEGAGVDPAHVEAMFEPFARWSRHRDSSGLGLAIARRLVEAHGGALTYRPRTDGHPHAFVVEVPSAG